LVWPERRRRPRRRPRARRPSPRHGAGPQDAPSAASLILADVDDRGRRTASGPASSNRSQAAAARRYVVQRRAAGAPLRLALEATSGPPALQQARRLWPGRHAHAQGWPSAGPCRRGTRDRWIRITSVRPPGSKASKTAFRRGDGATAATSAATVGISPVAVFELATLGPHDGIDHLGSQRTAHAVDSISGKQTSLAAMTCSRSPARAAPATSASLIGFDGIGYRSRAGSVRPSAPAVLSAGAPVCPAARYSLASAMECVP